MIQVYGASRGGRALAENAVTASPPTRA
jgi:hypothetical protein